MFSNSSEIIHYQLCGWVGLALWVYLYSYYPTQSRHPELVHSLASALYLGFAVAWLCLLLMFLLLDVVGATTSAAATCLRRTNQRSFATPNGNDMNCYERQSKLLICFRSTFRTNTAEAERPTQREGGTSGWQPAPVASSGNIPSPVPSLRRVFGNSATIRLDSWPPLLFVSSYVISAFAEVEAEKEQNIINCEINNLILQCLCS